MEITAAIKQTHRCGLGKTRRIKILPERRDADARRPVDAALGAPGPNRTVNNRCKLNLYLPNGCIRLYYNNTLNYCG